MEKKKLRIGIIGTGGIAHAHANAYKQFDDVEIVAGADIIPGKARKFLDFPLRMDRYGSPTI